MRRGGASGRGGPVLRLQGLVRKEFLQVIRDPSSIAIAFLMPVALLLLFGYGISLDAEHVPIALVIDHPSSEASSLAGSFRGSRYFDVAPFATLRLARAALMEHEVDAIVRLQADFARRVQAEGPAPIQLIVNGVDANTARLIEGYAQGVWAGWLAQRAEERGEASSGPVSLEHRVWFNAELRSRDYLVPGLIAVIMTLIGALLTAMVVAREWERGTMEALLVTPVTMREMLLGKLLPYFLLGMGGMALSVAMAVALFGVPLRGSPAMLFGASSLFLLAALGMGFFISIAAKNQFVAGQAAIITTFLPAFMLSGFIFDIGSMPAAIQYMTYLFAARYFVAILQTVFLAGDVWAVILPNALALAVMATVFLGLTWRLSRKRLE